jgi:hypothetical protein
VYGVWMLSSTGSAYDVLFFIDAIRGGEPIHALTGGDMSPTPT